MVSKTLISEEDSFSLWRRLDVLRQEIDSEYDIWEGPRFDVNRFLEVFDKVKTEDGCVLDYVYHGGRPFVYTRRTNTEPFSSLEALARIYPDPNKAIQHVVFEKSPWGFFQFAIFDVAVDQFLLFDHGHYNQLETVCSQTQLEVLINNPERLQFSGSPSLEDLNRFFVPWLHDNLKDVSMQPVVQVDGETGQVTLMTFSPWLGFRFLTSHIRWPHRVEKVEYQDTLIPYWCGIKI